MAEETQQESKKTVVSFIVGLLIGGLLVWAFSGPAADAPATDDAEAPASADETTAASDENDEANDDEEMTEDAAADTETDEEVSSPDTTADAADKEPAELPTGEGAVAVGDQAAGDRVALERVVFPIDEGWIAVRSYTDEQLGNILGAARFSKEQGLVPEAVPLLAPTTAGNEYAIVFFTENGDREFNLANDVQVDSVFATFTAQ